MGSILVLIAPNPKKHAGTPMRIAIVLNTSWNIYNFRMNFVKELLANGHEVHTVAPVDGYTQFLIEAGCIHHPITMDSRGANPIKDLALIWELGRTYRKVKPEIILHYTIKPNVYGTLAAAFLKIPVVNNVCGLGTVFLKDDLVSKIAVGLYRLSFKYASKVFFQNPEDKDLFISKGLVIPHAADLVPGSGIDLTKFSPSTSEKREKPFTFLLISRLISDKGIYEYIQAIEKLKGSGKKFQFQLMGALDENHRRGITSKALNDWINAGLVDYLGTTDDVRPFINNADCIVLPSYREGTPRTLLEAASLAKPIITTDVAGCRQVVEHGVNGFLCELKNADDLAEKMAEMGALEAKTLAELGLNGRKKMISNFNESLVIEKYLETLSALRKAS